jgi:hypothetical protein
MFLIVLPVFVGFENRPISVFQSFFCVHKPMFFGRNCSSDEPHLNPASFAPDSFPSNHSPTPVVLASPPLPSTGAGCEDLPELG